MSTGDDRPEATVVITSRNRRDDLRRAVASAFAQRPVPEVLVIDDGSTDGTSDMVRSEFPDARLHRHDVSTGLIVARNVGARLARGRVIVSIDDDAVFSTPSVVAAAVADLSSDERIGAVAIPHRDVNRPAEEQSPRAPDRHGVWITSTFRGTAYAVRRDVFLEVGGFRGELVHQGEEADFCLRMLDRGWLCRLGTGDEIEHFESPKRDNERQDLYGGRNVLLVSWLNVPHPWLAVYLAGYLLKNLRYGRTHRRDRRMLRASWRGLAAIAAARAERRPVRRSTFALDRRIRRTKAVRLAEIAERRELRGAA